MGRAFLSLDYNEMVELLITISHADYLVNRRVEPIDEVEAVNIDLTQRTLRRMLGLIESSLNLARIESGKASIIT